MHAISNEGPKQRGLAWSMFSLPLFHSSSQHAENSQPLRILPFL